MASGPGAVGEALLSPDHGVPLGARRVLQLLLLVSVCSGSGEII